MTNKKAFSELTEQGKKARLKKYEEERAARGTQESLVRLVQPATFKDIKGDAKLAVFRFAMFNKEAKKTEFFTASAYVAKEKVGGKLEAFYASLEKGQLVAVEWKENNGYNNIYDIIDRSSSDNRKKPAKAEAVAVSADTNLD